MVTSERTPARWWRLRPAYSSYTDACDLRPDPTRGRGHRLCPRHALRGPRGTLRPDGSTGAPPARAGDGSDPGTVVVGPVDGCRTGLRADDGWQSAGTGPAGGMGFSEVYRYWYRIQH
jgi:hypothetical protein